jgi:hypothetical protein
MPNRIDIDERPSIVDARTRLNSLPLSKVKVLTQCLSGVSSLLIASFAFCAVLLVMGSARYSLLLRSARVAKRGLNENHNGLLRQFFPKRMALDNVSEKEAFRAADLSE